MMIPIARTGAGGAVSRNVGLLVALRVVVLVALPTAKAFDASDENYKANHRDSSDPGDSRGQRCHNH